MWQTYSVTRQDRERHNGHKGAIVWLTGLPGSGKTTLARTVELRLHHMGFHTIVLDGDNVRHGLCADLGFSAQDRNENIRRIGQTAKLFLEAGMIVIVAFVSPLRKARDEARSAVAAEDFFEIYCNCPVSTCKKRDPKGLYAQAEKGLITDFTGISSPYEPPLAPDLVLRTGAEPVDQSAQQLIDYLLNQGLKPPKSP
ncbi:MAG: adenylyl-sulfate kinase [Proteobacteria bacterium]|nr:adenylyl-sulfate kinase [Pseudomonadota bacterium]